nr:hypothetical protein CFP56_65249 [Quercus suber]
MYTNTEHLTAGIATASNFTATEIPTRIGTKRKRIGNDNGIENIPWTAARCNRLLRGIASRISILERVCKSDRRKLQTETPIRSFSDTPRRGDCGRLDGLAWSTATPSKDPEWLPQDRKATGITTYGGKPRLRNVTGTMGERGQTKHEVGLSFPTPFVKRILQAEPATQSDGENAPARSKALTRSKQLPIQTSSSVEEAHRNLISAFDGFLVCTKDQEPVRKPACPSLRSMVLRRVPELIELEESQQDNSNDFDIAAELYIDLESLGHGAQRGWCGLQDVVRAHGIRKLELAVSRRLLPGHVVKSLIRICERRAAIDEGRKLLLALAFSSTATKSGEVVDLLLNYCSRNGCRGFLFQALARLLQEKDNFFSAVTEKPTVWQECVTAMVESGSRAAVLAFLEAFALRSEIVKASLGTDAITSQASATFTNVIALSTAMALSTGELDSAEQSIGAFLFRSATSNFIDAGRSELGLPLLLSNLVFVAMGFKPATSICALDLNTIVSSAMKAGPGVFGPTTKNSAEFACEVARCLDCLSKGVGEEVFHAIARGFLNLAASVTSENGKILEKLALDTASAYLEQSSCKTSEEFVDEIEALVLIGSDTVPSTPIPKARFGEASYRWEAGIQEWIAQTPFVRQKAKSEVVAKSSEEPNSNRPTGSTSTTVSHPLQVQKSVSADSRSRSVSDSSYNNKATNQSWKRVKITLDSTEDKAKSGEMTDSHAGPMGQRKSDIGRKSRSLGVQWSQQPKCCARNLKRVSTHSCRVALQPITNQAVHALYETAQKRHSCLKNIGDAKCDVDELSMNCAKIKTRLINPSRAKGGRAKESHRISEQIVRSAALRYDQGSEDELAM